MARFEVAERAAAQATERADGAVLLATRATEAAHDLSSTVTRLKTEIEQDREFVSHIRKNADAEASALKVARKAVQSFKQEAANWQGRADVAERALSQASAELARIKSTLSKLV